jgi:LytS/YehU family sensor histidine kinase
LTSIQQAHIISRKNIYKVFLVINIIAGLFRYSIFNNKDLGFHLILFSVSYAVFISVWEIILVFHNWISSKITLDKKPITNITIQIVFGFILGTLIVRTVIFYFAVKFGVQEINMLKNFSVLIVFFLISIIYLVLIGSYFFYQWKENLLYNEALKRDQAQVKFDALKNQVNPHFLFNALAALNSLIFENQQLASDFLQQLSKVYRYILQNKEQAVVTVEAELKFVEHYIALQKTRYDENVLFLMEVQEIDFDKKIVPVSLQILIENVFKHNIINGENKMQISITSNTEYLTVSNFLQPKEQIEDSNQQGLENLKSLYRFLSEKEVQVLVTAHSFTVNLPLI